MRWGRVEGRQETLKMPAKVDTIIKAQGGKQLNVCTNSVTILRNKAPHPRLVAVIIAGPPVYGANHNLYVHGFPVAKNHHP